jgi:hypothetical protein
MNKATSIIRLISVLPKSVMQKWIMISFIVAGVTAHAQTNYSTKSFTASIQGTSTLHDWESKIEKLVCTGSFQIVNGRLLAIKTIAVKIPVNGIKSAEGKGMDDKIYEAFKSEKNPFITYSFISAQIKNNNVHDIIIELVGNLTIAGVTRKIFFSRKRENTGERRSVIFIFKENKNDRL